MDGEKGGSRGLAQCSPKLGFARLSRRPTARSLTTSVSICDPPPGVLILEWVVIEMLVRVSRASFVPFCDPPVHLLFVVVDPLIENSQRSCWGCPLYFFFSAVVGLLCLAPVGSVSLGVARFVRSLS